jgi:hypothetical protein
MGISVVIRNLEDLSDALGCFVSPNQITGKRFASAPDISHRIFEFRKIAQIVSRSSRDNHVCRQGMPDHSQQYLNSALAVDLVDGCHRTSIGAALGIDSDALPGASFNRK